ncbi:MAG: hypothetical protein WEB60_04650 [Terrimicrobiaceae bacterium]
MPSLFHCSVVFGVALDDGKAAEEGYEVGEPSDKFFTLCDH